MSGWIDLCGSLRIQQKRAPKVVRNLLEEALPAFAALNRQLFHRTGDHGFAYRERQLHSTLLPALRDVAGVVFREQPVRRGRRESGIDGWVDYWLDLHDQVVLMEIKHGFLSMVRGAINRTEVDKWLKLQEQMDTVVHTAGPSVMANGDRALVVGLHVLVHWGSGDRREDNEKASAASWDRHQSVLRALQDNEPVYPVCWHALWTVPGDMQVAEWGDATETYPAVSFFAAACKSKKAR